MKEGDIVICINIDDSDDYWTTRRDDLSFLILNKKYKIIGISIMGTTILIDDSINRPRWYYKWRFVTLKQLRKIKLDKLNNHCNL